MKGFGRKDEIEGALSELGRQMALRDASHLTVLCCGAAALCAVDALSRSTLDVDAVGAVNPDDEIVPLEAFSTDTAAAIAATAQKLGLHSDWFNLEASAILERGLPEGAVARSASHARAFGPCLSVRFMDRLDLVALKMFAALDPAKGRRHAEDLVAINPSREEIRHGLRWMAAWPSNLHFKVALHNLAEAFDCGDVAREVLADHKTSSGR
jgi:hypothetical protein